MIDILFSWMPLDLVIQLIIDLFALMAFVLTLFQEMRHRKNKEVLTKDNLESMKTMINDIKNDVKKIKGPEPGARPDSSYSN